MLQLGSMMVILIYIQRQEETTRSAFTVLLDVVHIGGRMLTHMALHMAQRGMTRLATLEKDAPSRCRLQYEIHTRADGHDLAIHMFCVISMIEARSQQRNSTNTYQ
jgi:hypothetical protein